MSLDQNLFTLLITPNKDDPNVIDLIDNSPNPIIHYRKQRVAAGQNYKIEVYDPLSESLLITVTALSATSKLKTLELCNPTKVVELKYSGTISFKWSFKWEDHEFEWKREECYLLRKPDPPVLVAVTKVAQGRYKTSSVQMLDYNINRFDFDDRKGLEIVILTALLTFQDSNDQYHGPREEAVSPVVPPSVPSKTAALPRNPSNSPAAPIPPPKPAPKTGLARIVEMQMLRGEYNEITVEDEGKVEDYAQYCWNLLQDDALLFVTIRSDAAEQVTKVLQVVEETKRIRYKTGISDEEELHQYVLYDTAAAKKGPKRINLDTDSKSKTNYAPPTSLTIHLSKIPMPELQPKVSGNEKANKDSRKADDKLKGKRKEERKAPPESNRVSLPATSAPPSAHQRIPSRQPSPQTARQNDPGPYGSPTLQMPPRHGRVTSFSSSSSAPPTFPISPSESRPSPYGPYAPNQPSAQAPQPQAPQQPPPSSVITSFWDMLHRH